jgi:glycogen(starch) synthase
MQSLSTSDYRGWSQEDEEDSYPLYVSLLCSSAVMLICLLCSPLVMKVRSRSGSVMSGASTPGGGAHKSLSEGDLKMADAALSRVNVDGSAGLEGAS